MEDFDQGEDGAGFPECECLLCFVVRGFSHYIYSNVAEKEFYSISKEATVRLNYHLDYYFRQLQQSTHSLISSDRIQQWLTSMNYTNEDIQNVEKELRSYLALNYSETQGMFLIPMYNPVVSMAQSFAKLDRLTNEPWYDRPLSGNLEILPTHIAKYEIANGRPVVSVFLPIFDKNSMDLIGRLVVDVSLQEIERSLQSSKLGSSGTFLSCPLKIPSCTIPMKSGTDCRWPRLTLLPCEFQMNSRQPSSVIRARII